MKDANTYCKILSEKRCWQISRIRITTSESKGVHEKKKKIRVSNEWKKQDTNQNDEWGSNA
jgi:hypothetical protein